ncbi:MAG: sugar phosphate nucleotidyltransferase [Nitrospirota bacterium]
MHEKVNIFILAAGLGERLRPITDYIPKSLLPILGKPVLQSILEKISTLPTKKIGINLHHKKEMIEKWIKQFNFGGSIHLFFEDPLLGTGGALKNAEEFLKDDGFLVQNSDIVSDIDLEKLIESHLSSENLVTLAVHDHQEFNNLFIDERGLLQHPHPSPSSLSPCGRGQGGGGTVRCVAFTGIAVCSPEFLKYLPEGFSNVVDGWLKAIKAGHRIGTLDVSGCYWSDVGTPVSYVRAIIHELRRIGETVYIHPSVKDCENVEMDGYVVVEKGCRLDKDLFLRNCILLPETDIESHLTPLFERGAGGIFNKGEFLIENCIHGPGFKIDINEAEALGLLENNLLLIGTGGSDRKYYRVERTGSTRVIMKCLPEDADFQRHLEYTRFFRRQSIPVPELIEVKPEEKTALFEDLGDISLYSWLKCQRKQSEIEKVYRRVLDALILIHTVATENISECPLLQNKVFDYEHLRWETDYFVERFVKGIRGVSIRNPSALNDDFHRLALKVDSFPKTVIHRDFQSQNIMITKGRLPRILDYQGARIGPPAYDIVSILWDPYYRLEGGLGERLLDYYIGRMSENPVRIFNEGDFIETLLPCRLQRHMQALGAYGFLSTVKGKRHFLKYVLRGLRLLKEDISFSKKEYPELDNLVNEL